MADTPAQPAPEEGVDTLRADAARYGVAYAIMRDGFKGKGVDRAVLAMKLVIAVIAVYALVSAIVGGVGG